MNEELIKREALIRRIDEWLNDELPDDLVELLQDCRAALLSQSKENKSLSDLSVKDILLINELNDKIQKQEAEIESLQTKKYVPMEDDDFMRVDISTGMHDPKEAWAYERNIETEVIRRAGLEIQE